MTTVIEHNRCCFRMYPTEVGKITNMEDGRRPRPSTWLCATTTVILCLHVVSLPRERAIENRNYAARAQFETRASVRGVFYFFFSYPCKNLTIELVFIRRKRKRGKKKMVVQRLFKKNDQIFYILCIKVTTIFFYVLFILRFDHFIYLSCVIIYIESYYFI